jgi:hypothetical protein
MKVVEKLPNLCEAATDEKTDSWNLEIMNRDTETKLTCRNTAFTY